MKTTITNKDNALAFMYMKATSALFHKKTNISQRVPLNSQQQKNENEEHKSNMLLPSLLGRKIELESPTRDNSVEKPRHYPPANKEWFNSIYTYGKNASTQKLAPTLDKVTQKLVKGYLDFYSDKLEGRVKPITKRMRR